MTMDSKKPVPSHRMGIIQRITSFLTLAAATALQCKDDSGHDVAWWVAVKAPRGTKYWYGDASAPSVFAQSSHSMNDTDVGALGATLRQIWTAAPAYILWNDDPPQSTYYNFSYGHTKGALVVDTTSNGGGFWLTHSVPQFPAGPALQPTGYVGLGSNAWMYGQSAACFSLPTTDTTALSILATTLQFNHPHVYDTGGDFSAAPASVAELAGGEWRSEAICQQEALELGGVSTTVFAKTPAWNADLWSGCVSPALKSDLWVESWLRGSEEGPACGTTWQTLDVQRLAWGWKSYDDHSKWAIAPNASALCIGDINRMTTQYERAGGAVCFTAGPVAAFSAAVSTTDSC
jgi:deoxyribonuclease-2